MNVEGPTRLTPTSSHLRQTALFFDAIEFLRRTRPLGALSSEDLIGLTLNVELRDCAIGTRAVPLDEPEGSAYLIWEGEVETADGDQTSTLHHGEWLDAALTSESERTVPIAVRPTRLLCIPAADLGAISERYPAVQAHFGELMRQRYPGQVDPEPVERRHG